MTEIEFPKTHTLDFDRDVIKFPAVVNSKRIMCRITLEEMGREICFVTPSTFEDEFQRCRDKVENHAKSLIVEKLKNESSG